MITREFIAPVLATSLPLCHVIPCIAQDVVPKASPPQERSETSPPLPPTDHAIRNAPSPRAIEFAAYVFSASNVCGYRIGVPEFTELRAKLNVKPEDVSPRGPFGTRIQSTFALMSNDMARHREQSCLAVAGEYGPDGTIAKNVLQPAQQSETTPPATKPVE